MKIYISTLGRPDKQITIQSFSKRLLKKTALVVVPEEYDVHKKYGIELVKLPKHIKGLSANRQWLLENADERYVSFMDDDIQFSVRYDGIRLRKCEPEDVEGLIELWEDWMKEEIPFVGVSLRGGNNRVETDYQDIGRIMSCFALDRNVFIKEGFRFDRIPLMQDLDVSLQVLRGGYLNRMSYKYAHNQASGSGSKGGCSAYRTPELIREVSIKLSRFHPGLIKVTAKKSKTAWEGMEKKKGIDGTVRTDVNVSWKKAYKPKFRKKDGITRFL
jgi:glycosyltransferase involved in cell wall biosynthesis